MQVAIKIWRNQMDFLFWPKSYLKPLLFSRIKKQGILCLKYFLSLKAYLLTGIRCKYVSVSSYKIKFELEEKLFLNAVDILKRTANFCNQEVLWICSEEKKSFNWAKLFGIRKISRFDQPIQMTQHITTCVLLQQPMKNKCQGRWKLRQDRDRVGRCR